MQNYSADQIEGATAKRSPATFGLTSRALAFAKRMAEYPLIEPTVCARQVGYAANCKKAAHVRAAELLRDPRVVRAIVHFGGLALNKARIDAIGHLAALAEKDRGHWKTRDERTFNCIATALAQVEGHVARLEAIYERKRENE